MVVIARAASTDTGEILRWVLPVGGYRGEVAQVLIVEDDLAIRQSLRRALADAGHAVSSASDALSGLRAAVERRPDVVLLDLGLPDLDGAAVLQMIRSVSDVPVVVITARAEESEVVRLLDLGADDYVVKPFGPRQIHARIGAVLRRSAEKRLGPVVVGGLVVDDGGRTAVLDDVPLALSRREFDLLSYLVRHAGHVVSKRELLTEVWQQPYGSGDRTVDVHLSWLRRKLGERAEAPRYIHSVRGVGVRLAAPDDP